jgi:Arc/MetJ family transcription regulator
MRRRITITLDESVATRTKEMAGLIPFSRYVESILIKEIKAKESEPAEVRE